jgi:hypothetical protein
MVDGYMKLAFYPQIHKIQLVEITTQFVSHNRKDPMALLDIHNASEMMKKAIPAGTITGAATDSWAWTRAPATTSCPQATGSNTKAAFPGKVARFPTFIAFHLITPPTSSSTCST